MWKKSFIVFLLVLLLVPFLSFGLTNEEEEMLPKLSKEALIRIILIYEDDLTKTEQSLIEREISLDEREKSLIEKEAHIKLRENLLAELYMIRETENRRQFWKGIVIGGGSGLLLGGVGGYQLSPP